MKNICAIWSILDNCKYDGAAHILNKVPTDLIF